MCWRRWIGMMALMGVLLHAAAVVRHHAAMLAQSLDPAAATVLAADLKLICHFDPDDAAVGKTSLPGVTKHCPLCSGLASVFVLPQPSQLEAPRQAAVREPYRFLPDQRVEQLKRIRPPGRGPPALA